MTRALRHEVPVNDKPHDIVLAGPILHVGGKGVVDVVDVWTQDEGRTRTVRLLAVGTGQPWPDEAFWLGTAVVPGGNLVWHLLGLPS